MLTHLEYCLEPNSKTTPKHLKSKSVYLGTETTTTLNNYSIRCLESLEVNNFTD